MKKHRYIIFLTAGSLLFLGCDSLRSFMARDLEEEDFVVGKLYEDELVSETPVINEQHDGPGCSAQVAANPMGLEYSPSDNCALYEAVNSWLGVPYKYGGTDRNGIDCSAFVAHIYKLVYGVNLHRSSNDMLRDVTLVARNSLQEGDILFFTNSKGKVSHVGIYLKDDLFAHASTTNGVSVSRLTDAYWSKHFYKGGRVDK
jgi:lipoprotein Spr